MTHMKALRDVTIGSTSLYYSTDYRFIISHKTNDCAAVVHMSHPNVLFGCVRIDLVFADESVPTLGFVCV